MQFVDEAEIEVTGGTGGNGCVAFRREKYVPFGGPSGGDGGKGGDVILRTDEGLSTLLDLRYRRTITAESGEHGRGKDQYGAGGADEVIRVPVGTQVFDARTGELLVDLSSKDSEFVIAEGGRGGRGNIHFSTPTDRSPRKAEPGGEGERRKLRIVLKLLADVGVVGFPNVGKSTFIANVSRARPKIADYPFTTLTPNLGVASLGEERNFVIADIPGIIEGASEGAGLGLRFLKHVERTRVLLHVVTADPDPTREPLKDYKILLKELERFDANLATRPMVVAMSKADLPETREAFPAFEKALKRRGITPLLFSAPTREGLDKVLIALETELRLSREEEGEPQEDQSGREAGRSVNGEANARAYNDGGGQGQAPRPKEDREGCQGREVQTAEERAEGNACGESSPRGEGITRGEGDEEKDRQKEKEEAVSRGSPECGVRYSAGQLT
jgi:GTP-binding protein